MKKVAFHNLGCKVNSYELDGISQMFQKRGYEIVDFAQKADIYVINTCTVTNIADRKSRQMLSRARSLNPDAVIVAAGCYVQTGDMDDIEKTADIAVGNNLKSSIVDIVEDYIKNKKNDFSWNVTDLSKSREYEHMPITETSGHTRAFLKIQDGCDMFCSYCAIPLARGRSRSRDVDDIVAEAKILAKKGYKEIVLTGIHLSSFGLDRPYNETASKDVTNTALLDVIEKIACIEGVERIRLGSLEPRLITEEFATRLAAEKKVCGHFHLSLQSGCDSVLDRMNRHYTTETVFEKVAVLRKMYEHPAITADIITGFPGETQEEFADTRRFLNELDPYECHIFKYSRRKGTVADRMKGQLTDAVKSERSTILASDNAERKQRFMDWYIGRKVKVLAEETIVKDGRQWSVGYTPEYVRVMMPPVNGGSISEILCFEGDFDIMIGVMP